MNKYYWIKERHNPQFLKPYFITFGNISTKEAKRHEKSSYGYNYMLKFSSKEEYEQYINKLKSEGFNVGER